MNWMLNRKQSFAVIVVAALLLIAVTFFAKSQPTQAQDSDSTLRALFEDVQQRSANDPNFVAYVKFTSAPSGDQTVWTIPNHDPQVGVELSDIGDEYVCFNTPSEQGELHQ